MLKTNEDSNQDIDFNLYNKDENPEQSKIIEEYISLSNFEKTDKPILLMEPKEIFFCKDENQVLQRKYVLLKNQDVVTHSFKLFAPENKLIKVEAIIQSDENHIKTQSIEDFIPITINAGDKLLLLIKYNPEKNQDDVNCNLKITAEKESINLSIQVIKCDPEGRFAKCCLSKLENHINIIEEFVCENPLQPLPSKSDLIVKEDNFSDFERDMVFISDAEILEIKKQFEQKNDIDFKKGKVAIYAYKCESESESKFFHSDGDFYPFVLLSGMLKVVTVAASTIIMFYTVAIVGMALASIECAVSKTVGDDSSIIKIGSYFLSKRD